MSIYKTDFQKLWKDGRFFAQLNVPHASPQQGHSDGTLIGEVLAVATSLVGSAYQLGTVPLPFAPTENLEVYEALTYILPTLSDQSAFYWERAARSLASMLATAQYPIRAQASHLIFWWARLGGLMGPKSISDRTGPQEFSATSDGSNLEYSWAISPSADSIDAPNRKVRFSIDPFHPGDGQRMAAAFIDHLFSDEGGMGLVQTEAGVMQWKEIIEKWLFPDIKSTEEFVNGSYYGVAVEMERSSAITLKGYYVPPLPLSLGPDPKTAVGSYRGMPICPEPMLRLAKELHPSLETSMSVWMEFLQSLDPEIRKGMTLVMIAFDMTSSEKNRLKIYVKAERTKLKDMVYDMTLGGRITGPRIDETMNRFSQFMRRMFPYMESDDADLLILNMGGKMRRDHLHMMYYYEFRIGEPLPYPKVYFFMDRLSKNDYETAHATELFFKDIGNYDADGWMIDALSHALPHRPLNKRNGMHTMISFGTRATGWDVTNYYSPEIFAAEREN